MTVLLGLPRRQAFNGFVFILVAFDVVVGEVDWETVQDVDDSAFQVALRRQAVV